MVGEMIILGWKWFLRCMRSGKIPECQGRYTDSATCRGINIPLGIDKEIKPSRPEDNGGDSKSRMGWF